MKILLELRNVLVSDVEMERKTLLKNNNLALSRAGMIRCLLKEALAMRKFAPDVHDEVNRLRLQYEAQLQARGDMLETEVVSVEEEASRATQSIVSVINKLGTIAHKKEIVVQLRLKENVVGQRLKKALYTETIFRMYRGIYTTVQREVGQSLSLEESDALYRARQASHWKAKDWVLKD